MELELGKWLTTEEQEKLYLAHNEKYWVSWELGLRKFEALNGYKIATRVRPKQTLARHMFYTILTLKDKVTYHPWTNSHRAINLCSFILCKIGDSTKRIEICYSLTMFFTFYLALTHPTLTNNEEEPLGFFRHWSLANVCITQPTFSIPLNQHLIASASHRGETLSHWCIYTSCGLKNHFISFLGTRIFNQWAFFNSQIKK